MRETTLRRRSSGRLVGEVGRLGDGSRYAREADRVGAPGTGEVRQDTVGYHRILDELGYTWVQRYELPEGAGSPEWRVFTERGEPAAAVTLPRSLRLASISADAITGVWTHDLGHQEVRVHPLDRRGATAARPPLPGCG